MPNKFNILNVVVHAAMIVYVIVASKSVVCDMYRIYF
jgi:hypothetical protein